MKHLRITVEGKAYDVAVEIVGTESSAEVMPRARAAGSPKGGRAALVPPPAPVAQPAASTATATAVEQGGAGAVRSPLAALVVSIDVAVGDEVKAGDRLVTLEAMKMNTIVNASHPGKVTAIHVAAADGVEEGQALVSVE